MSLLLSQGHADARCYPVGVLAAETRIVARRINHMLAVGGIVQRAASASVWSREGGKHFSEVVRRLNR